MAIPSDAALWLGLAWAAIVAMAVVITQWRPRHTHPAPAQCRCVDCTPQRLGG